MNKKRLLGLIVVFYIFILPSAHADGQGQYGLPDRIIVGYYSGIPDNMREELAKYGAVLDLENKKLRYSVVHSKDNQKLLDILKSLPYVKYVEYDYKASISFLPNDPYYPQQWGPKDIFSEEAWEMTLGSQERIIAIIDTGVQYSHPDLQANMWKDADGNYGYNFVARNNDPYDDNGHGTHVAGIASAITNNNAGISGISQSKIMAVKVLDKDGSGYYSWVANGIVWAADHNANVISLSLGGSANSTVLQDAVNYAWNKGVLLVAAAGNNNGGSINYPATYSSVIAVSALNRDDTIASYSSTGQKIELAAPGTDIYSTYLTSSYQPLSGTSMATPFVSGVAALVWSKNTSLSNKQVRDILDKSAYDLGQIGRDSYFGFGKVDAYRSVLNATPPNDITPPATPRNLTASNISSSRVDLSWEESWDDVGILRYDVYRSQNNANYTSIGRTQSTNYIDKGLQPNSSYYYYVKATDTSLNPSQPSNIANITTPENTTPPTPPENLTALAGNSYITLSWNPPSFDGGAEITNYTIYRGEALENQTLLLTLGNVSNYTDSDLLNGNTYYYKVGAINRVGESGLSNEANATPMDLPPDPPTSLVAIAISPSEIKLSWNASKDDLAVYGYNIFRSIDNSTFNQIASTQNTSFRDTTVQVNSTYYYYVTAYDGANNTSPPSNIAIATTPAAPRGHIDITGHSESARLYIFGYLQLESTISAIAADTPGNVKYIYAFDKNWTYLHIIKAQITINDMTFDIRNFATIAGNTISFDLSSYSFKEGDQVTIQAETIYRNVTRGTYSVTAAFDPGRSDTSILTLDGVPTQGGTLVNSKR